MLPPGERSRGLEAQRALKDGRGAGGTAGCKPHKVILQNVYAKRFNGEARRGDARKRGHSLRDSIRDNPDKTPLRRQTYLVQLTSEEYPSRLPIDAIDYFPPTSLPRFSFSILNGTTRDQIEISPE